LTTNRLEYDVFLKLVDRLYDEINIWDIRQVALKDQRFITEGLFLCPTGSVLEK